MAASGPDTTMVGKTCLVTGATSGIGRVTAEALAARGATVVLAGRDPGRCEAAVGAIRAATGNPAVESLVADLSAQADVRRLAREFLDRHGRLEVLVNNAGAMIAPRRESVDGIEMTWALNHLGYFLLTTLLLDALKASAPARVVSVASEAHRLCPGIDFDDVEGKRGYRPLRAYSQSKLANVLFNRELARRLEGTGVTANCLHPGFVATNFTNGEGWTFRAFQVAARLLAITPEKGAETTIYLAASPQVEGASGGYFAKSKEAVASKAGRDVKAARRLWTLSEGMVSA